MANDLRYAYDLACQDLASLQGHLDLLELSGVANPWAPALCSDLDRFARALRAAVADVERRRNEPHPMEPIELPAVSLLEKPGAHASRPE